MDRREFCRYMAVVGGTVMLTPVLDACTRIEAVLPPSAPTATFGSTATFAQPAPTSTTTPNPTPTPTPQEKSGRAKIALVRTRDRAAGVRHAIELLGLNPIRGNRVL